MSTTPAEVLPDVDHPAVSSARNPWLLAGGSFSLAFAVLQMAGAFAPPWLVAYGGGPVQMQEQSPALYITLCIVVGALIGVAGLYTLSGAGKLRRLPLLRTVLVGVTAIYLLRSLLLVPLVYLIVVRQALVPAQFVVFSFVALVVGLVHLVGTVRYFRLVKSGTASKA